MARHVPDDDAELDLPADLQPLDHRLTEAGLEFQHYIPSAEKLVAFAATLEAQSIAAPTTMGMAHPTARPFKLREPDGGRRNPRALIAGIAAALVVVIIFGAVIHSFAPQSTPAIHHLTQRQVYFGSDDGTVAAYAISTGARIWQTGLGKGTTYVYPQAADDTRVYVVVSNFTPKIGGPGTDALIALDGETGNLIWRFPNDASSYIGISHEVLYQAGIYFITNAENQFVLHALDSATGRERWNRDIGCCSYSGNAPVMANGIFYIGNDMGEPSGSGITAIRAIDGHILWRQNAPGNPSNDLYPYAVIGDTIFATGTGAPDKVTGRADPVLFALNLSDGSERWSYRANNTLSYFPVANQQAIYVTTDVERGNMATDTTVHALNLTNGAELWSAPTDFRGGDDPLAYEGTLYVVDLTSLRALQANGKQQWRFAPGGQLQNAPTLLDGMVFVAFNLWTQNSPHDPNTILYALRASDGKVLWSLPSSEQFLYTTAGKDALYLQTASNSDGPNPQRTYAVYDPLSGKLRWQAPGNIGFIESP